LHRYDAARIPRDPETMAVDRGARAPSFVSQNVATLSRPRPVKNDVTD